MAGWRCKGNPRPAHMHILITGAAGMIGRKLVARLAGEGTLDGRAIEKLTLIDVGTPPKPEKFSAPRSGATWDCPMLIFASAMSTRQPSRK